MKKANMQRSCFEARDFDALIGFKLVEIEDRKTDSGDELIIFTFMNDYHVVIDMIQMDGELSVSEPYAVKED